MRYWALIPVLFLWYSGSSVAGMSAEERRAFLDAIRPEVVAEAGQDVRFKVDRLNVDGNWAVLVGGILGAPGKLIDWSRARDCDPTLDKLLWVVARRTESSWKIKHLSICASEPPYWYLKQFGGFVWPCGVYAGLSANGEDDLELECRKYKRKKR